MTQRRRRRNVLVQRKRVSFRTPPFLPGLCVISYFFFFFVSFRLQQRIDVVQFKGLSVDCHFSSCIIINQYEATVKRSDNDDDDDERNRTRYCTFFSRSLFNSVPDFLPLLNSNNYYYRIQFFIISIPIVRPHCVPP